MDVMSTMEERKFQDAGELLAACREKMRENQHGESGGNYALYPTVIVFLGEKARSHVQYVKQTLDENWNNADYLQYLGITVTEKSIKCQTLTTKGKEITWKTCKSTAPQAICIAVVEMLTQEDKIFPDKTRIKMEFLLDAAEEAGKTYYDLFAEMSSGLQTNDLKTLYLMADQTPEDKNHITSDKLFQYILKRRQEMPERSGTLYLISNYLESGKILGEKELWQNYRLTADIILLGGNRTRGKSQTADYAAKLYNGIKTASYALVTKPIDEIGTVSLRYLLSVLYEQERSRLQGGITEEEIRRRLGIGQTNTMEMVERLYRDTLQKQLPRAEDMGYLPFMNAEKQKELLKTLTKGEEFPQALLDQYTLGVWPLFVQKGFLQPVEDYWEKEENREILRQAVSDLYCQRFSSFELMELSSKQKSIERLLMEPYHYGGCGGKTDYREVLYAAAEYAGKALLYEKVKPVLLEEFSKVLLQAKAFDEQYQQILRQLQMESIPVEAQSVEKKYAALVEKYVMEHQKINEVGTAFPEVFCMRQNREEFLGSVWKILCDLIQEDVYRYDFEREIEWRMSDMTEVKKEAFVKLELQKSLTGSTRLKNVLTYGKMVAGCFYLINESAAYAKHLAGLEANGRDFMIFDLNRTDGVEQIEIYNITKPECIHLAGSGEQRDED